MDFWILKPSNLFSIFTSTPRDSHDHLTSLLYYPSLPPVASKHSLLRVWPWSPLLSVTILSLGDLISPHDVNDRAYVENKPTALCCLGSMTWQIYFAQKWALDSYPQKCVPPPGFCFFTNDTTLSLFAVHFQKSRSHSCSSTFLHSPSLLNHSTTFINSASKNICLI